jgi:methenyltetrahydrofolate cyclohydrolase
MSTTSCQQVGRFVHALAAKQSTPGGGAAAAVGAAVGAAAANMAAIYTHHRPSNKAQQTVGGESLAALRAQRLMDAINVDGLLKLADDDAEAYADLQRTWKETDMSYDEKAAIEKRALAIPTSLADSRISAALQFKHFIGRKGWCTSIGRCRQSCLPNSLGQ